MGNNYTGAIVSSFNIDNFAAYLNNHTNGIKMKATSTQYGQVIQTLMDVKFWSENPDFAVIWTLPEAISKTFNKLINYEEIDVKDIFEEIDWYCELVKKIKKTVKKAIFIPTWVIPSSYQRTGMLEMKNNVGVSNILMQMNLRLSMNFDEEPNIFLLNMQKWVENVGGKKAFNPKMWYLGKIAFGNDIFKEAVKDIVSALNGISGNAKKLVIVDLDETLWGGIVGDVGWKNIVLGGHDPTGEAFIDFQKALKALTNRGILLAIVSKNEESIAKETIEKHPEMVLRLGDFAGWKINWLDKVHNVKTLVKELNIGLQSVVFIDDSPVERALIRNFLPEVLVPEWPQDKLLYKKALNELDCFNKPAFSKEDAKRTRMYAEERQRREVKIKIADIEEWLKTLETIVSVDEITDSNKGRAVQLFNKTNQMNLSTRRMTEVELLNWLKSGKRKLWTFRVSDKFGDSGLTGIISLDFRDKDAGQIVDFILSCRVIGRKIEETMICVAFEHAKKIGIKKIFVNYIPTVKNKPCFDFWENKSGFRKTEKGVFELKTSEKYKLPECIKLKK